MHVLFVHVCEWAHAFKYMDGRLFLYHIVKVELKGTAHAPLSGSDSVAMASHSSAEKCICLLELNQMKAALPGFSLPQALAFEGASPAVSLWTYSWFKKT